MSEKNLRPKKIKASSKEETKAEKEEGEQEEKVGEPSSAQKNDAMAAQIDQNNTDLTARIAQAINLTNSVAGITSGTNPAPGVNYLQSLFPPQGVATNSSVQQAYQLQSLFPLQGIAASSTQALGTALVATAPAPGAPKVAMAAQVAQLPGQPPGQDNLLSLLSSNYNFLTPSDMDLPLNDPSVFLPTPFAPGEDANTFQHDDVPQYGWLSTTPDSIDSISPIPPVTLPPNGMPMAGMPAAMMPGAAMPVTSMPATTPQLAFLQQLAAAYAVGGGHQPMFAPSALMAGGMLNPALMNGLLQRNNPMGMAAGIPASLNAGISGIPETLNPGIAGIPAALNPGIAGLPGMGSLMGGLNPSLIGNSRNLAQSTVTNSTTTSMGSNLSRSLNNAMATMPQFSVQEQIDRLNALPSSATAAAMMPDSAPSFRENPMSLKKQASSVSVESDPLIKSREARWIIRYNELLEVRA